MTRMSSARGLTALAVLGIVALGGTSACASSATVPGGSGAGSTSASPASPTPTLLPLPPVGTPTATPTPAPPTPPGKGTVSATPSNIKADGYTTSGTTLTVQFVGGVCVTYSLKAEPSTAATVRVTIMATPKTPAARACPMLEKEQTVSTDLGAPLDGRTVVDTVSDRPVPQVTTPLPGGGRMTHGPVKQ